jgi:hypothetical protein
MSWHKITLPLMTFDVDPQVVEIGDLAREAYIRENHPKGFGMLHATRGSKGGYEDKFLIYLSPVAYELCGEKIGALYTLEPCDVPARDEPDIAWVFGDPLVKNELKDKFEPEPGTFEWENAQALQAENDQMNAEYQAQAKEDDEAAQADSAQA